MQEKEGRVPRNVSVGTFLDDSMDFCPIGLQETAEPKDVEEVTGLLPTPPA